MLPNRIQARVPRITLRIPGPWRTAQELARRLPVGFEIEDQYLLLPRRRRLFLEALPADGDFPGVFRMVCRRRPQQAELQGLDNYGMNAGITAPGGSTAAAQQILEAAAGLVRAGGVGVFIDNSAIAHGGLDWLELAEHRADTAALFYAFVNFVKSADDICSHGMQVFGERDGVIAHGSNSEAAICPLEDFLRSRCVDQRQLVEGQDFCDAQGSRYWLRPEPDPSAFRNHPMQNPYGRWRLEPL